MPQSNVFDARLDEMIAKVQACQNELDHTSCMKCEKLIGCELRKQYVLITYESMSKGEIGGFEF